MTGPESPPKLELKGVSMVLGHQCVLDRIDLAVGAGEVVGLIGPNGAGKTSLLRLAAGSLEPTQGEVRLGSELSGSLSRRALARRVALVPQDMHVPFPFRVGELVLMGRTPHQPWVGLESDEDVERAREALARLGIESLSDREVTTLSGGERQLVLFARALVQDPGLLLLDEPTAFLDLRHRLEVLQEVRAFVGSGRAALIVSHDLSLSARTCDRIVLLGEGRVIADGAPGEVLRPDFLRAAFGIETRCFEGPDGGLVVVPMLPG